MSDNKFIKHLRGENTAKSVLEIKNQRTTTSFANMPDGTSNANDIYSDHRGNATGVLKGSENWKLDGQNLVETTTVYGDGRDLTSDHEASGNGLWVDATVVFATARRFNANTKFILKLCGHDLETVINHTVDFTLIVKFGTSNLISKTFTVTEQAFDFCKEFVIDFAESNSSTIKADAGSTMQVQLLCADANARATIYDGMTVFTALQRRVDGDAVASDKKTFDEVVQDIDDINDEIDQIHEDVETIQDDIVEIQGDIEDINNKIIVRSAIMPTPSADLLGKNYQYAGTTNAQYTHNYIYECVAEGSTYSWVRVNVQPDYATEIQELETDVDNIQAVIPEQATPTNQLVTQDTTTQMQQQINHLQTIGRFLSFWDATTGLAQTNPQTSPYIYQTGDYFRVGVVAGPGGTNYKPSGSSYTTGVASTVVETERLTVGQVYYYDGANWALAAGGSVAIDETTITFNNNDEIQAVATVNQNTATGATNPVYDWVGTLAEYQAQNIETLHPDWLCYITDDVSGGDSVYTKAQVDEKFQEKATAVNDNNITNCLTHIPQDIKLELNNGTLTLKAGSKVYVPNGAGVFDEVVIQNDIITAFGNNDSRLLFVKSGENLLDAMPVDFCYSGPSAPSWAQYMLWYDTTNNYVKYTNDSGSTWTIQNSLPIAEITTGSGQISSIDQIFNGFGYIGSTVFALPGVKGLIPDGRNADGSLKCIEIETTSVLIDTHAYSETYQHWIVLTQGGAINAWDTVLWVGYNESENIIFNKNGNSAATTGQQLKMCVLATVGYTTNGKITSFTPKTAFHALDYNDSEYIAHQAMPSTRYINLTLGASGATYKAVADGYVSVVGSSTGSDSYVVIVNKNIFATGREPSTGFGVRAWLPVSKGDSFRVEYNQYSNQSFRFIYAQGAI